MPLIAAKAIIEVEAGVIPGQPIPSFTKRWGYTSEEYQKDRSKTQDEETIFSTRLKEAHDYAMGLSDPALANWVRVDWIWI
jgi:hypothetical protein